MSEVMVGMGADLDRLKRRVGEGEREVDLDPGEWLKLLWIEGATQKVEALKQVGKAHGWEIREVRVMADIGDQGGQASVPPDTAMGGTFELEKIIAVKREISDSAKVYLLCHELGHALSGQEQIWLDGLTARMLEIGILMRNEIPSIVDHEVVAETVAGLVLMGLGGEPNWRYFSNWNITPEMITEHEDKALAIAAEVLGAMGQVGVGVGQVEAQVELPVAA